MKTLPSVFPDEIDEFGNPKVDIQTADIPDIDDFQYFKAKYPRSMAEGYQLMQLRELLADKVILARDINHMRNAIIEIEKYLRKLADEIEKLKERVTILEQETIIGGNNLGSGEGVFESVANRIMNFKSIKGGGDVQVTSDGDEITIGVDVPEPPEAETGCGKSLRGSNFKVCEGTEDDAKFPMSIKSGVFKFTKTGTFGFYMVDLKPAGVANQVFSSLMISLGEGAQGDQDGAGRILKCVDGYIFEVKHGNGKYSGLEIRTSVVDWYRDVSVSKVQKELNNQPNPYDMSWIGSL